MSYNSIVGYAIPLYTISKDEYERDKWRELKRYKFSHGLPYLPEQISP